MNTELMEALTILEKEKNISKDVMMDAIENSLLSACKNHFGTAENIKVIMDRETCDYAVFAGDAPFGTERAPRAAFHQLAGDDQLVADMGGGAVVHFEMGGNGIQVQRA